jgi:glycosyltransferase involved in cell wall biosynthesis
MTPGAPLVSILTPAYNSAAFIEETIASARSQIFGDFEMLIVDDGSTDDTIEIVRSAAREDPRIVQLSSPHGGPAAARNAGIARARGQFMALLDSDDVWKPEYLSSQLELLNQYPGISIVTANAVNRGGALDGQFVWPAASGIRELSIRDLIEHENSVCIMSIFRRRVVDRIGGFHAAYTANEDYEFWLRAMNDGFRLLQNGTPLGHYRRRPNSVSADDVRMLNGIIAVLESAQQLHGCLELQSPALRRKLEYFREELVKAEIRVSLAGRDGVTASRGLQALSRLRNDWRLALGARLTAVFPDMAVRAYGLRCALRSWAR